MSEGLYYAFLIVVMLLAYGSNEVFDFIKSSSHARNERLLKEQKHRLAMIQIEAARKHELLLAELSQNSVEKFDMRLKSALAKPGTEMFEEDMQEHVKNCRL